MARVSKLLTDEIVSLAESGLKKTNSLKNQLKLKAIIAAKKHGIKKVAKIYNVSHTALIRWIHRLRDESLEGLNNKPKKPRSILTLGHQKTIETWISNDKSITIEALRIKIEKELGIKIGKTAVHGVIQKLGFVYVKSRPSNRKRAADKKQSGSNYWMQAKE